MKIKVENGFIKIGQNIIKVADISSISYDYDYRAYVICLKNRQKIPIYIPPDHIWNAIRKSEQEKNKKGKKNERQTNNCTKHTT